MNLSFSSTPVSAGPAPSHHDISECARVIWSESGEPSGCDDEIWLEAERRLVAARPLPVSGSSHSPLLMPQMPTAAASTPPESSKHNQHDRHGHRSSAQRR